MGGQGRRPAIASSLLSSDEAGRSAFSSHEVDRPSLSGHEVDRSDFTAEDAAGIGPFQCHETIDRKTFDLDRVGRFRCAQTIDRKPSERDGVGRFQSGERRDPSDAASGGGGVCAIACGQRCNPRQSPLLQASGAPMLAIVVGHGRQTQRDAHRAQLARKLLGQASQVVVG